MECPHEGPGRRVADVTDAEAGQQPPGFVRLGGLDAGEQLVGVLFPADDALRNEFVPVILQRIDVRVGLEITLFDQGLHQRLAEAHDVHAAPGSEVRDGPGQLGGTARVHTADVRRVLFPDQRFSADRAAVRRLIDGGRFLHTLHQFRDDVPGLQDGVDAADADLLLPDVVLVVQGDIGDVRAAEAGRFPGLGVHDPADEGDLSGPADGGRDIFHDHRSLLRRIFVGDVPARVFRPRRELVPEGGLVDLYDGAVEVVVQFAPHLADGFDGADHVIRGLTEAMHHHRDAGFRQAVHAGAVARRQGFRALLDVEDEHAQAPLLRDGGVQLAQGAGGQVPRVGGGLLPQLLHALVVALEIFMAHVDFAAERQDLVGQVQRQRDVRDDAGIGRHVFSDEPIAPGLCQNEPHGPVPVAAVGDGHGEAVHLDLHRELCPGVACVDFFDKGADRVEFEDVFDGQHGDGVGHLDAGLPFDGAADFLGRRVRVHPLRMLLLRRFQLLHELIVLEVGDVRRVLIVVPVHVVFDFIP